MFKNIVFSMLVLFLGWGLSGCDSDSKSAQETTYQKRNQTLAVESEPTSYRKYALVSSGDIKVEKTLSTDGPLADVHANGEIEARSLSLDISGKITASNEFSGSLIRSFNYESPLDDSGFVKVRALKVEEYLNTNDLDEYYLLTSDGKALHKVKDSDDEEINDEDVELTYENNSWVIQGDDVTFAYPLVVQSNLKIETSHLFVAGTLMVQGDLNATGELNINTGTPFEKALIVDNNIELDKLVAIGRVHGSGTFTSHDEVNILGNAEIDGDITLYGDAKINFLDNVYKSALYEAQEESNESNESNETNASMMLVHSQLFSDVKGKNSVVLFTFVEGNYILNENIINELIENNETDEFKFKSYLYGASIDYGAQLQKFNGLSPYYANKQAIYKKLKNDGYENIKISESLDIAPSNLYHTFKDQDDNTIGTYQVYSISANFDDNNLTLLTQEQRDETIYKIEHKDEIEATQETEAKTKEAEQKEQLSSSEDLNESAKSEVLESIQNVENNESTIDKEATLQEATNDRVQEWVEYRDLAVEDQEIDAEKISIEEETQTRGWLKKIVKKVTKVVKKVFKVVTFTDCKKKTSSRAILHVTNSDSFNIYKDDKWSREIALNNNDIDYCTPISASMILNYHRIRKGKSPLYSTDRDTPERYLAATNNAYVEKMAGKFGTSKNSGTWDLYFRVPWYITQELRNNGTNGFAFSYYTAVWNRALQHYLIEKYINRNNPVMFSAWQNHGNIDGESTDNHTMPVIGYKHEYYNGVCWKKIMPDKKWILVDSTWMKKNISYSDYTNSRAYLRFDMRSNYFKLGTLTYVNVW